MKHSGKGGEKYDLRKRKLFLELCSERRQLCRFHEKYEMELSLRNFQKDGNLRLRTFESLGKESLEIIEKNVEPFSMEI